MKKYFSILVLILLFINALSCSQNTQSTQASIGPGIFRSAQYKIEVQLPSGWAAAEGPETLYGQRVTGAVAFNSWGQVDFWTRQVIEINSANHSSSRYGPTVIASQVPDGGAYAALEIHSVPTIPPSADSTSTPTEYALEGLSGLYELQDWREDTSNYAYYKIFFKGGSWYALVIVCKQTATDETVEQLNALLKSWRFR